MASINKIMLAGRLTRDPEIRTTSNGLKVASFDIAVDRYGRSENGEKKTDFFRCKAWRQKADFVEEYVQKGRLVFVEGRVELDKYTDKDGQTRNTFDIVVEQIQPLESARSQGSGDYEDGSDAPAPRTAQPSNRAPQPNAAPARPARPSYNGGGGGNGNGNVTANRTPSRVTSAPGDDDDFDDSDPFAD